MGIALLSLMILNMAFFTGGAWADSTAEINLTSQADSSGRCVTCPAEKFGRGVSNIATSPLELPLRIGKEMEQTDPIAGFFAGSLKGVFWFAGRLIAGAFETVTFFIPTKPLICPFDAGWWSA